MFRFKNYLPTMFNPVPPSVWGNSIQVSGDESIHVMRTYVKDQLIGIAEPT